MESDQSEENKENENTKVTLNLKENEQFIVEGEDLEEDEEEGLDPNEIMISRVRKKYYKIEVDKREQVQKIKQQLLDSFKERIEEHCHRRFSTCLAIEIYSNSSDNALHMFLKVDVGDDEVIHVRVDHSNSNWELVETRVGLTIDHPIEWIGN